jgi:uncharacterized membrane protein
MDFAIFSMDGVLFLLRWFHFFFGIIWIGLLYYFNFVQGPFFTEIDAATKGTAVQKLVPRALWWFRFGAMYTFIMGLFTLMIRGQAECRRNFTLKSHRYFKVGDTKNAHAFALGIF